MASKFKLSPSALNLFKECPKCFWLEKNKWLKRPFGIFPSLPGGMDEIIKKYFDEKRKEAELPEEIRDGHIKELFKDQATLDKWRGWNTTDLQYTDEETGASLSGALDECVIDQHDEFCPFDYKTKGSPLHYNPAKYYQTQLDCYALMLQAKGYPIGRYGYLLYYWPVKIKARGDILFEVKLFRTEINPDNAKQLIKDIVKMLNQPCPDPNPECSYCNFYKKRVQKDFKKGDIDG